MEIKCTNTSSFAVVSTVLTAKILPHKDCLWPAACSKWFRLWLDRQLLVVLLCLYPCNYGFYQPSGARQFELYTPMLNVFNMRPS